ELKMCLHELSVVNDTLEALGVPKEYQRMRNWLIRIIIGWIVYIFYRMASHVYELFLCCDVLLNFVTVIYIIFVTYYPEFVIILSALIWGTILRLVYRLSQNDCQIFCVLIERTKLSRRVLYHFAIFAIVKMLITKNRLILAFNNFLLKHYQNFKKNIK
ncbi:hypothetical protein ALC57_01176, partial [Trachymyrmex cornetzi]